MDVLTPAQIEHVTIYFYNIAATFSTIFTLFCIFVILRYSSNAMNGGYRFHLLNITIFTLFCDLNITVLTRHISLSPANGECYTGKLLVLTKWMDVGALMQLIIVSCFGMFWRHIV
jgi:hypothetical protein